MHIAVDASRTTVRRATGTERYALQLIRALIRRNTRHDITLYFRDQPPRGLLPASGRVTQRVIPSPRLWTHIRFAVELWRGRPDVTFVPAHSLPLFFPGRGVVTVHDLGYKYFPDAHPPLQRRYLDRMTRRSARRATVVLADSQATARDLTRLDGIAAEKIRVVYPGIDAPCAGKAGPILPDPCWGESESVRAIRKKYRLPKRYFLFIGTLQPRKNIARIVYAYSMWRAMHRDNLAGLVLAGSVGWLYDERWTMGVEGVVMPGYIDDEDKGALYAGALALVFPSLYEGFGFPVVEALACGTPVIASNTASLPELTGEAGLLVDPLDVKAIAGAMARLSDDAALRAALREKGYAQAAKFTWDAAAAQVMDIFDWLDAAARHECL